MLVVWAVVASGCGGKETTTVDEALYVAKDLTAPESFTSGVEGPAVGADGTVYAVNYAEQHTIGQVHPSGAPSGVFVTLPNGSVGNGIRFDSDGAMLIADYPNHNVLRVDMASRDITVYAHEPRMSQPNDLAIGANDIVYCSDPNWGESTGQIWRVTKGQATLLEADMGTTNGIEVSPDENKLYVNESKQRNVWAYDLSPAGEVSNKRLLHRFPDHGMDGMRCDADGNLYITRYGKGTIAVVSPIGDVVREITLTGKNPSNIAFGGPDGRTCYVTLADRGNIEEFRTDRPGRSWVLMQR